MHPQNVTSVRVRPKSVKSKPNTIRARKLLESLSHMDYVSDENIPQNQIDNFFVYEPKNLLFKHRDFNIPSYLSDIKLLNVNSDSMIKLTKNEAFKEYYDYTIYLRRKCYKMMSSLFRKYTHLTNLKGIPKEYKMKYWMECEENLINDMKDIENTTADMFYYHIKNRNIWRINFVRFLRRCKKLWIGTMNSNKNKWIDILSDKINNHKSSTAYPGE
ncbi:RAD protein (Pv-fam-e) [Plasmodium ovale curtisi]|nr:RAD protein (Pv-fam-e) [Plasmodium ovale curtisi]SBT01951.1 RAD protein (Pv-fam-e) [Plasmodium ovale curtisi]